MTVVRRNTIGIAILDILRAKTDADHPMRYAQIAAALQSYGLSPTRKSIASNIADLRQAGYPLQFRHGWYYQHEFTAQELNLLVDGIYASSQLPEEERKTLIWKLKILGGECFIPSVESDQMMRHSPEFRENLEKLHRAVREGLQVSFHYCDYGTDKQLHRCQDERGRSRVYRLEPYYMTAIQGSFYIIGYEPKQDAFCHFRIDRITDLKVARQKTRELPQVNLPQGSRYRPAGNTEKPRTFAVRIDKRLVNDALDTFGMNIAFRNERERTVEMTAKSDPALMAYWLSRHPEDAALIRGRLNQPASSGETAESGK